MKLETGLTVEQMRRPSGSMTQTAKKSTKVKIPQVQRLPKPQLLQDS